MCSQGFTNRTSHFLVKYNKDDGFTAFLTSENMDRVLLRNVTRRWESVNTASPSLPTCCANGPGLSIYFIALSMVIHILLCFSATD